jgi:phosphatidate phosphatase APP1
VSQERLGNVLVAAVEAATAHPDWQDGDEMCFIVGDVDDTMISTRGFRRTRDLTRILQFHADKLRQAE